MERGIQAVHGISRLFGGGHEHAVVYVLKCLLEVEKHFAVVMAGEGRRDGRPDLLSPGPVPTPSTGLVVKTWASVGGSPPSDLRGPASQI